MWRNTYHEAQHHLIPGDDDWHIPVKNIIRMEIHIYWWQILKYEEQDDTYCLVPRCGSSEASSVRNKNENVIRPHKCHGMYVSFIRNIHAVHLKNYAHSSASFCLVMVQISRNLVTLQNVILHTAQQFYCVKKLLENWEINNGQLMLHDIWFSRATPLAVSRCNSHSSLAPCDSLHMYQCSSATQSGPPFDNTD